MRQITSINFDWKFIPDFKEEYLNQFDIENQIGVMIPHTMMETTLNNFNELDYQFIGTYNKNLEITEQMKNERIFVEFEGIMNVAKVYLNGTLLIIHEGGYTPFEVDITKNAVVGQNLLQVIVDSTEIKDVPPFGKTVDYLGFSGIYREVTLKVLPKTYIKKFHTNTTESGGLEKDKVVLNIDLGIVQEEELEYDIYIVITHDGVVTHHRKFEKPIVSDEIFSARLNDILRWDVDNPNLYTCTVQILKDEKVIDETSKTIGFRTAKFTPEGFLLNNEPLKLIGLNRHQSYPFVGYAMPRSMQELDADILKDFGCNIVRTSHYMQSEHFLNRCDEIGLLVLEETPGWQYIGNDHFKELTFQNIETMIEKHFNHPSIITWGVRINESIDDHEFYSKTNELAKKCDPTRQTCGVRNMKKSEFLEDIYTYNDFSHVGNNPGLEMPNKVVRGYIPYLVTEHNGHIFPTKKFDSEVRRIEHSLRHANVIDAAFSENRISGAIGWCLADYNTHFNFGSNDRVCYHGVMDMFRIPKYAAYAYKSQKSTDPVLFIANNIIPGDYKEFKLPEIVIYSNCDYIKIYKNDQFIGQFYSEWKLYPDIPYAPFIIDDLIGDLIIDNEKYKEKDAKKITNLLLSYNRNGFKLSFKDKLKYLSLSLRKVLDITDLMNLYEEYLAFQSKIPVVFKVEGYKADELVITKYKGHAEKFELKVNINNKELIHEDTYDVARVVISLQDQFDNTVTYSNEVLKITTSKNLEVIGPNNISLIGGSIGVYVKTLSKGLKEWIQIESNDYGKVKLNLKIK
ncbi:MAG: glycoside hydrolase family 2 protein [Tenericutes bacterium]|nr:glycoside hydrolase family 2 protein [Mycoplasmatota bacterium]